MVVKEMISSLADNPYFGAGFGLFGLGAGTAILRKLFMAGSILFRRHYMTTLEVPCRDKSYHWLLTWITEKGATSTQHLSVETKFTQIETGKVLTKHEFMPSVGEHFFWYRGSWLRVDRTRSEKTMDLHMAVPWETVSLTAVGDKRRLFYEMLEDAKHLALEKTAGMTIMYTAMGSEWRVFGNPRKPRPLHSVVLDTGLTDAICRDVEEFLNCSQWYVDRGIPYRRGYLLHGPPGCGKSSFITALAGHLQLAVCVLNLSERGLTDDRLNHLLAVAPENSIILLEDIDSAFVSRQDSAKVRTAYEGLTPVTFSGLLNCLDGVASTEARIVFMTTNYRERLDPALIRPGRVDMIQYIGHCSSQQLEELYIRFYPEQPHGAAQAFSQAVTDLGRPVSAAEVQGHFQQHKHDPHGALDGVPQLGGVEQGITTPHKPPTIGSVTSAVGSVRGYCTLAADAGSVMRYSSTLTADAGSVKRYSSTLAADAGSVMRYSSSLTADAGSVKRYSSTLAADAGSVMRYSSSLTADAGSVKRYSSTLAADAMREYSAVTAQGVERKGCGKRISSLVRRLDTEC